MTTNCGCPIGAHLPDLVIPECKESLGQIQKVIFMRTHTAAGVLISLSVSTLALLSSMTTYLTKTDSYKMLVSPFIQNPTTEPGAARTFGGGNQTLNGIEIVIGREATAFTGVIYQESQSVIKVLKELQCEGSLGVFLIDENGNIACIDDSATASGLGLVRPIPISNLFIGDKNLGGLEEPDSNAIQWSFLPNWSDKLVIIKKAGGTLAGTSYNAFDYNPLVDLEIPEEEEEEVEEEVEEA